MLRVHKENFFKIKIMTEINSMTKIINELIKTGKSYNPTHDNYVDTNKVTDGYHTFAELYDFRKVYNAVLFNEWARQDLYNVHKSKKHFDGEDCFGGGWFIVMAVLPTGQISNHYELKDWDLFDVPATETAIVQFDGHTSKDVLERLQRLIKL